LLNGPVEVEFSALIFANYTVDDLARYLERQELRNKVVVNETGLQGQYDFVVDVAGIGVDKGLEKIGLLLKPVRRNIQAVYVTRTRSE
jgi:hypothetical protein